MVKPVYSQRQELYDVVFILAQKMGFKVFDELPPMNTPYPFVHLNRPSSRAVYHGKFYKATEVPMTINVWGTQSDGGSHDLIMWQLEQELLKLEKTEHNFLKLLSLDTNTTRVVEDNEKLLHGTINVEYKLY